MKEKPQSEKNTKPSSTASVYNKWYCSETVFPYSVFSPPPPTVPRIGYTYIENNLFTKNFTLDCN